MNRLQHFKKWELLFCIMVFALSLFAQDTRQVGTEFLSTFKYKPENKETATSRTNMQPVNRRINGTFNNATFRQWGSTDIALSRAMPAYYSAPDVFNGMAGHNRKSAREISNTLCVQYGSRPSQQGLSSFTFTWGQFIDHDITLSGEGHTESVPIFLPTNENAFSIPIPFNRSEVMPGTGQNSPREQMNLITSWLDASMVYGSDRQRADWLRTFSDGKLKTSTGHLLPYNTHNGERNGAVDPNAPEMAAIPGNAPTHFVAGDVRANEQPGLTALHTLFVREHNRYCDILISQGYRNDNRIYQLARKWVGGLIQQVTYTEFLPALGILIPPYRGYNSFIKPDIMNEFATAAFRIGHTMVTEELLVLNGRCAAIDANTSLMGNFFNNTLIQTYGIGPIFRGLAAQTEEEIDLAIVDNLRSFLFQIPGAPPMGLDLAALNIQRGRDHGLPDYNTFRHHFLGQRAVSFNQITNNLYTQNQLQQAYNWDINNIDPWIGLLAEDHVPGTSVGPTMYKILQMQFLRLRDGDYYYFENDPNFANQEKRQIRQTKLDQIIKRNSGITNLQTNVFKVAGCQSVNDNGNGNNGNGNGNNGNGNKGKTKNNLIINGINSSRSSKAANQVASSLVIFPNPTNQEAFIDLAAYQGKQVQLMVQNQVGQVVYQLPIAEVQERYQRIPADEFSTGLYFITLQSEEELMSGKLVVGKKY